MLAIERREIGGETIAALRGANAARASLTGTLARMAARVLLLDDDRQLTAMLGEYLGGFGFAVTDALLDRVRGSAGEAFDRSIDVHVSRIRAAIEDDPKQPRRLLTVRGAGYVFAKRHDEVGAE